MSPDSSQSIPLTSQAVQELYELHAEKLTRFLYGVLRDHAAVADALQATFVKLLEKGHTLDQQSAVKPWLFKVAFNEALAINRKAAVRKRHAEPVAWKIAWDGTADQGQDPKISQSVHFVLQQEKIEQVQQALSQLPAELQSVVRLRIFEGLKFKDIAQRLNAPLGTVLARMQSSLKKLEPLLNQWNDES